MMNHKNPDVYEIFFNRVARDTSKYLVPRVPYFDAAQRRHIIDYAILSENPTLPRVAILIQPAEAQRPPEQQRTLHICMEALKNQNWVPVTFSTDDIEFRPRYVKSVLCDIFYGKVSDTTPQQSQHWLLALLAGHPLEKLAVSCLVLAILALPVVLACGPFKKTDLFEVTSKTFLQRSSSHIRERDGNSSIVSRPVHLSGDTHRTAPPKSRSTGGFRVRHAKVIPVIHLDRSLPEQRDEAPPVVPEDNPLHDTETGEPLYVATVRYCTSGIVCVLQNNQHIELWGVQEAGNLAAGESAAANLNELLAGRQITFEARKTLPDKVIVKAILNDRDVAEIQVEKGVLKPNPDGDMYRSIAQAKAL